MAGDDRGSLNNKSVNLLQSHSNAIMWDLSSLNSEVHEVHENNISEATEVKKIQNEKQNSLKMIDEYDNEFFIHACYFYTWL